MTGSNVQHAQRLIKALEKAEQLTVGYDYDAQRKVCAQYVMVTLMKEVERLTTKMHDNESMIKQQNGIIREKNRAIRTKDRAIEKLTTEAERIDKNLQIAHAKRIPIGDTKRMDWLCSSNNMDAYVSLSKASHEAHPNDLRAAISHAMEHSK